MAMHCFLMMSLNEGGNSSVDSEHHLEHSGCSFHFRVFVSLVMDIYIDLQMFNDDNHPVTYVFSRSPSLSRLQLVVNGVKQFVN